MSYVTILSVCALLPAEERGSQRSDRQHEPRRPPKGETETRTEPIVSIVVPFLGLPVRILSIELVKPKKGTTMETIGKTLRR